MTKKISSAFNPAPLILCEYIFNCPRFWQRWKARNKKGNPEKLCLPRRKKKKLFPTCFVFPLRNDIKKKFWVETFSISIFFSPVGKPGGINLFDPPGLYNDYVKRITKSVVVVSPGNHLSVPFLFLNRFTIQIFNLNRLQWDDQTSLRNVLRLKFLRIFVYKVFAIEKKDRTALSNLYKWSRFRLLGCCTVRLCFTTFSSSGNLFNWVSRIVCSPLDLVLVKFTPDTTRWRQRVSHDRFDVIRNGDR